MPASSDNRGSVRAHGAAHVATAQDMVQSNYTSQHFLGLGSRQRPWMNGGGVPTANNVGPSNSNTRRLKATMPPDSRSPTTSLIPAPAIQAASSPPVQHVPNAEGPQNQHLPSPAASASDNPLINFNNYADRAYQGPTNNLTLGQGLATSGSPESTNTTFSENGRKRSTGIVSAELQKRLRLSQPPAVPGNDSAVTAIQEGTPATTSILSNVQQHPPVSPPRPPAGQPQRTWSAIANAAFLTFQQRIDAFITSRGGPDRMHNLSEMRLRLLREACFLGDHFYLCLHQVYCLAAVDGEELLNFTKFGNEQCIGIRQLEQTLVSNANIPLDDLQFFSIFPHDTNADYQVSLPYPFSYQRTMEQVFNFLQNFGVGWTVVHRSCMERGCPPWREELAQLLGIGSTILQQLLFTQVHRQLGGHDDLGWGKAGLLLFSESRVSTMQQPQPGSPQTEHQHSQPSIAKRTQEYKRIREAGRRVAHGSAPQLLSPSSPWSPTQVSQSMGISNSSLEFVVPHTHPQAVQPARQGPQPPMDAQTSNLGLAYSNSGQQVSLSPGGQLPSFSDKRSRSRRIQRPPVPPYQPAIVTSNGQIVSTHDSYLPHQRIVASDHPHPGRQGNVSVAMPFVQDPVRPNPARAPQAFSSLPHNSTTLRSSPGQIAGHADGTRPTNLLFPGSAVDLTQSTNPDPQQMALHQMHLNSPVAKKIDRVGNEGPEIRLYQFFDTFSMPPTALGGIDHHFTWEFSVSMADWKRKARCSSPATLTTPSSRWYTDGSCLFRLRCCAHNTKSASFPDHVWNVRDNAWPSSCFISMNEHDLELRRKPHHGRDLALDLTNFIREGNNKLTLSVLRSEEERTKRFYTVAIEMVEVRDEQSVWRAITMINAKSSLSSITGSLRGKDDDDELLVVDPHLSIDLIDPFTARMVQTPVRGRHCLHRECFDLNTFLQTRKCRVQGGPVSADEWKCPICRADARPSSLVLDEFLLQVRREVEERGLSNAKAILVKADGTWDAREVVNDEGTSGREASGSMSTPRMSAEAKDNVESVVIEIVDD